MIEGEDWRSSKELPESLSGITCLALCSEFRAIILSTFGFQYPENSKP